MGVILSKLRKRSDVTEYQSQTPSGFSTVRREHADSINDFRKPFEMMRVQIEFPKKQSALIDHTILQTQSTFEQKKFNLSRNRYESKGI